MFNAHDRDGLSQLLSTFGYEAVKDEWDDNTGGCWGNDVGFISGPYGLGGLATLCG